LVKTVCHAFNFSAFRYFQTNGANFIKSMFINFSLNFTA